MYKTILYLVGPSGSGKTTISDILCSTYGYDRIKSVTTRGVRDSDDYKSYTFQSKSEFLKGVEDGEFLEYAEYAGNYYGTRVSDILVQNTNTPIAVKVIEIEGLIKILKSGFHYNNDVDYFIIYLNPKFDTYECELMSRSNWKDRINSDKKLYDKLISFIDDYNLYKDSHFRILDNYGDVNKVSARVNNQVLSLDNYSIVSHYLLHLPYSALMSSIKGGSKLSVKLYDITFEDVCINLYIRSDKYIDFFNLLLSNLSNRMEESNSGYALFNFNEHGVKVSISKEV